MVAATILNAILQAGQNQNSIIKRVMAEQSTEKKISWIDKLSRVAVVGFALMAVGAMIL